MALLWQPYYGAPHRRRHGMAALALGWALRRSAAAAAAASPIFSVFYEREQACHAPSAGARRITLPDLN